MLDGAGFIFDDDCEFVVDDAEDVDLADLPFDDNAGVSWRGRGGVPGEDEVEKVGTDLVKGRILPLVGGICPSNQPAQNGVLGEFRRGVIEKIGAHDEFRA